MTFRVNSSRMSCISDPRSNALIVAASSGDSNALKRRMCPRKYRKGQVAHASRLVAETGEFAGASCTPAAPATPDKLPSNSVNFPPRLRLRPPLARSRRMALPAEPASYFDIDDSESGDRFRQGVASIIEGIGSGLFPARPGPWVSHPERPGHENCRYCDFNSLCPARRGDLWQRKKSDASIAGYLSLSGEDEEE